MRRLAMILFGPVASTLAGVCVVAALVAGAGGLWPLLGAAAVGGVLGVPVSWAVARRMAGGKPGEVRDGPDQSGAAPRAASGCSDMK